MGTVQVFLWLKANVRLEKCETEIICVLSFKLYCNKPKYLKKSLLWWGGGPQISF